MSPRLKRFGEGIWVVEGPTVSFFGFAYPTRMAVAALDDGLWVWSPIELDDALGEELGELGEVRWLVEPNKLHHLFLPPWLERYPEAVAYAPPGLSEKRDDIAFAGELTDEPPPDWSGTIDQVVVGGGGAALEEVLFFHRPSSTCLVGDLVQRHDPDGFDGWRRVVMKADGLLGEHGSTPRELRATFFRRGPGRQALDTALGWDPERLIIAHGACAPEDGRAVLEDGLAWLTRPWPL